MPKQSLVDAAKASIIAYNKKDWNAVKAAVMPGFVYDEVGTQRKVRGIDDLLSTWRAWAAAIPDSKAAFRKAHVSGNTVILEVTWRGTHTGPLGMPGGEIAPTGNKIDLRACQVIEVAAGKAKAMRHYFDMKTLLQQLGVTS
jgi:steroid delta-isomerase-like uncharacterized protein